MAVALTYAGVERGAGAKGQATAASCSRPPRHLFTTGGPFQEGINEVVEAGPAGKGKDEAFLKSKRNPFSRNGAVTKLAERVPLVNNAVQGLHYMAGNQEAYERARRRNPFRSDGAFVAAAERLPLVNNVCQGVHRARGRADDLERAKDRNPLGHAGYVTQAVEHVPVAADAIRCIHLYRGLPDDAERARAYSLRKLVGKHGAITKLAELLPGTNLIAAALLELAGDRHEAQRALNMWKQYRDVASADGALAKLAELFPGTDIIAFGLQLHGGHYASALRAICKTRWVEISSKSTYLFIATGAIKDCVVLDVVSDLELRPKAYSLAGGLFDILIHWLDFNREGEPRRHMRTLMTGNGEAAHRRAGVRGSFQDVKIAKANEELQGCAASLTEQLPEMCGWAIDLANWAVYDWVPECPVSRNIMRAWYVLLPPLPYSPPPSEAYSARLAKGLQDSLAGVVVSHEPMPLNPDFFQVPLRRDRERQVHERWPEAAGAASCLSCVGCLAFGWPTGSLACLAGCAAGLGAVHRKVKQNLVPWINQSNASMWRWMSTPAATLVPNVPGAYPPFVPGTRLARQGTHTSASTSSCVSPSSSRSARSSHSPSSPPQLRPQQEPTFREPMPSKETASKEPASRAPADPEGIIFAWPPEVAERCLGTLVRDYLVEEFCSLRRPLNWLHPGSLVLGLFERQIRAFLDDALGGEAVPIAIPIPLGEGVYDGIECWLPEVRLMLVLWLQFKEDDRYIVAAKVAVVDGMLDSVANVVRAQALPHDLRDLDPRLEDFTEPVDLKVDIALRWTEANKLRLEFNNLSAKLHLPH